MIPNTAYLNALADRADLVARRADDSFCATGSRPSAHTCELARLVVALAAHLRDAAAEAERARAPWWRRRAAS